VRGLAGKADMAIDYLRTWCSTLLDEEEYDRCKQIEATWVVYAYYFLCHPSLPLFHPSNMPPPTLSSQGIELEGWRLEVRMSIR